MEPVDVRIAGAGPAALAAAAGLKRRRIPFVIIEEIRRALRHRAPFGERLARARPLGAVSAVGPAGWDVRRAAGDITRDSS